MSPEQIAALGSALASFLQAFACCFGRQPTFKHLLTYCRGLLSDLPRKSIEPIALAGDTSVRTLQEFLSQHAWQENRLRDLIQRRIIARHIPAPGHPLAANDPGVIGILDETAHPKKGDKTPGVQQQYCGHTGKLDNCLVTVHLALAYGAFQTLLDRDLFLPQAWADDGERRKEAKIPADLKHRPKWEIGLAQIRHARANGVRLDWLTFDADYGKAPAFLEELDTLGQLYVGEVPAIFRAWVRPPRYRSLRAEYTARQARHLVRWSEPFVYQDWQAMQMARQTLPAQEWEIKTHQVYLPTLRDRRVAKDRTYWLIHAWNRQTREHKYFLSNAPPTTALALLLQVAFSRARIEHCLRVAKTELGMSHFEGRTYPGLIRHLTLVLLAMLFVAEHTTRLRGEKSASDHGAGLPGPELHLQPVA